MSSRRSRSDGTWMDTVLMRKKRSWRRRPSLSAVSGLRFVEEIRRKSTGVAFGPPSRRTTRSSRTRRSLAWRPTGISMLSSSRTEPPSPSSRRAAMSAGVLAEAERLVGIARLLEDVERAGALRRLHRLAHRAVGRDDDDLERRVAPLELAREPDAVAVRQHEVEDRDVGLRLRDARERLPHARRGADRVALGLQRQAEAVGDRFLVVHHQHGPVPLHGRDTGSLIRTSVPWPTRLCTVSVPPWRSTTERAIDMPSPVPSVFVVKNGSNARARTSSVMPAPVSSLVTASRPGPGPRAGGTGRAPPP